MDIRGFLVTASFAAVAATAATSCGRGPRGDTWLVVMGSDTLTVSEAGQAWAELGEQQRQVFTSGENPVGDFVVAMSRRMLVENEVARLGYLDSAGVVVSSLAWARNTMFFAFQDSIRVGEEPGVSQEDIRFFKEHLGISVWYTVTGEEGPGRHGPLHLAVLGPDLGGILSELEPGGTAVLPDGDVICLDSLAAADSALVAEMLSDTSFIDEFALARISEWRATLIVDSIQRSAWEAAPPAFFAPAFSRFAAFVRGEQPLSPADTLLIFGDNLWTAFQMFHEATFEVRQRYADPADSIWLYDFGRALVNRTILAGEYRMMFPSAADSIMQESGRLAIRTAADSLYDNFVQDSVEITEEMLDSAYAAAPPELPETRSLVLVLMMPGEDLGAFRVAMAAGDPDAAVPSLDFVDYLSGGGPDPHVTRPLTPDEIPLGLGDTLFALPPGDRTWFGPVQYPGTDAWLAMRLDSVIPPHEASLEESRLLLFSSVLDRKLTERTEAWLAGLEAAYGIQMNQEILDDLPADPGMWAGM